MSNIGITVSALFFAETCRSDWVFGPMLTIAGPLSVLLEMIIINFETGPEVQIGGIWIYLVLPLLGFLQLYFVYLIGSWAGMIFAKFWRKTQSLSDASTFKSNIQYKIMLLLLVVMGSFFVANATLKNTCSQIQDLRL